MLFCYSVPIVLVGNKTDLYVDRMVTTEQGKRLADSWHAAFLETSAKQNEVLMKKKFDLPYLYIFQYFIILFQAVADIFHTLLLEIEKADGNVQEKSSCVVS